MTVSSSSVHQLLQRNIPEHHLQQHQYENRKFRIVMPVDGHAAVLLWLNRAEFHM
jgi:hypothetical protein